MQIKKLFITTLLIILTLFLPKTFAQEVLSVELIVPHAHHSTVYSIAFSPDGKIIVSRGGDKIQLWDTNTHRLLITLNGDGLFEGDIAFSPNGKIIAGGKNKKVRLWNTKTGKTLKTFDGHQKSIKTIAFSPDGKILASGSLDRTIRLWNISKGKLLHILENDRIGQISPLWLWISVRMGVSSQQHTLETQQFCSGIPILESYCKSLKRGSRRQYFHFHSVLMETR